MINKIRSLFALNGALSATQESITDLHVRSKINFAMSRGSAGATIRDIDLSEPITWEFSGFSQNGEDGIIDVLLKQLQNPNRYFVEIGASDGLENNTSWLALVRRYSGLMVEANATLSMNCRRYFDRLNWGLQVECMEVSLMNIDKVVAIALHTDPDILSLDIDGNDFFIASALLQKGFRPKVFVVEYNSAFGPEAPISVLYRERFDIDIQSDRLYYGVSIMGWRSLFERHGYRFVTVDQNGVNAFFVDPAHYPTSFLDSIRGLAFRENFAQFHRLRIAWQGQFAKIQNLGFEQIEKE